MREAQKYLGELQWLACRSRPDISFSVSRASRLVAKNPKYAIRAARQILAYLFHTVELRLRYGDVPAHAELSPELPYEKSVALVEAFSDASFGCEDGRSQSGVAVLLGGCLVAWLSVPQPFTTLSTCESELVRACEALTLSQAILPLWQELTEQEPQWVVITESVSAASVLLYPSGSWRTRHLRLRCRAYQELIEEEVLTLAHVEGQYQVADLLTKALSPKRIAQLLDYLGCIGNPNEGPGRVAKVPSKGSMVAPSKGVTKSLQVLSCLLSPVAAQPSQGLTGNERFQLWFWVVFLVAVLSLCCTVLGVLNRFRLERLRKMASLSVVCEEGSPKLGEFKVGKESFGAVVIPGARRAVGPPPKVGHWPQGIPKPPPPRAKPPPKAKPPPLILEEESVPEPGEVQRPPVTTPPRAKPPPKAKPPPLILEEESVPEAHEVLRPPIKRPPLIPKARFFIPSGDPIPKETPGLSKAAPPKSAYDQEVTAVHTPPRQKSAQLPPLLSYEELIQRAMRRELQREPTREEVEEEIRQMGIRNARSALRGDDSDSYDGTLSSESYTSEDSAREGSGQRDVRGNVEGTPKAPLSFTYLPPQPVPVLRLESPQGRGSESGSVIWRAIRVDGGRREETIVVANVRPTGSGDPPNYATSYVDDSISVPEGEGVGHPSAWADAQQAELEAMLQVGAVVVSAEGHVWLSGEEEPSLEGEMSHMEEDTLDYQLAAATLLLQQHSSFSVPPNEEHLTEPQRRIYRRLAAQWHDRTSEVD